MADVESGEPVTELGQLLGYPARPVTIAEAAGVSILTVCKVINGRSSVAADPRNRVEALNSQYGYRRPSPVTRSNTMELVSDQIEDESGLQIIRAASNGRPGNSASVSS
ncbi:LacI family DNA-binding transcriptional regulator [Solwaraspora sp. WMMD937]|uniref:LacI family DNA-binding transcriptional regulator n=1 Tax=Solwaraspora sp. WMMD937 TaxID=3016090 RepID=UPI00249ABF87|nr:LacI family DNA-binding transcriptional regulator [Solwaraspora sp. WMMD937]WFE19465.1 LacI family DNA-binding transcriptional regulator [Solwaraspora sp. WMMD937]